MAREGGEGTAAEGATAGGTSQEARRTADQSGKTASRPGGTTETEAGEK